jgi:hypothetical protein
MDEIDRALASLVAGVLPLGGYAEPLACNARDAGSAISPRALEFAADGRIGEDPPTLVFRPSGIGIASSRRSSR